MALLDSVILTPEPDLAERMLALEGTPPENPGKVMALGSIDAAEVGALASFWMVSMLLSPDKGWSSTDTLVTCLTVFVMLVFFVIRHRGLFSRMVESIQDFVASIIG
ncbi:hypothetical protein [Paraburkholderia sp.]|jgi:hypothetical protein|uniref:hypothetical protein n=1 Tax=Paraburkholderia sp. TaxID=1926495 RepID=UPI002F3F1528